MGSLSRWAALAGLAAAAGAGAAAATRRRKSTPGAPALAGVDGLGEPARLDDAPPPVPAPEVPHDEDAIAALDAARDRLRRRAEELRREIDES
ncbi:MAG: hypothetical protein IT200_06760 [Thermoleophilia bacterium]|nr:hypothetical protein [Thermoleophilia bacterium]